MSVLKLIKKLFYINIVYTMDLYERNKLGIYGSGRTLSLAVKMLPMGVGGRYKSSVTFCTGGENFVVLNI